ncbi:MAG: stress response translation initiation inhibitor YciH [Chloroflexi bacterium]|nr:stress response translation initiation inhibitor YciH [Chloroflexota bacterium]
MGKQGRLVYSSEEGRMPEVCSRCRSKPCRCVQEKPAAPAQQIAYIQRSSKGRAGKQVTLISGIALAPAQLDELGAALRKRCGTGGTIKDGIIELQGDQREAAAAFLKERGYKVKLSGG